MADKNKPCVRAVQCDHRATDEEVYQALKRATDPLDSAWEKIRKATRIGIKFNQAFDPKRLRYIEGNLQELVDYKTARATLRLIRDHNPDAQILVTEISGRYDNVHKLEETITLLDVMRDYGAAFVNGDVPPLKTYKVPKGGLMFQQYLLPESVVDVDAFVSVQKIKNHAFMGVTLTTKNLFGLPPTEPHGRNRGYFHHIIRLSYVLVDLAQIINPTLSILDGLVGQSGREWGGEGRIGDCLIAGDQCIATDACGTHLMGFDPLTDWPNQPFVRDRNHILIAHEHGFGTADLDQIDFQSEVYAPVADFLTDETDPYETVKAWRRTTCEQALFYRDHQRQFVEQFPGEYILLQDGVVVWHDKQSDLGASRRDLAGSKKDSALFMKYVDPEEAEGEHFERYDWELVNLREVREPVR